MSGSFDRPARPGAGAPPPPFYDPYDEVPTGPATGRMGPRGDATGFSGGSAPLDTALRADYPPPPDRGHGTELHAPARGDKRGRRGADPIDTPAPIVPAGSVTGRSLTLVIAIMCCLACLTAGAVYLMNQSAKAWLKDIASEVTVQVEPRDKADTEKTVKDVVALLAAQPGIANARPLSLESSTQLLEPWLGTSEALKSLPVPRLIALEIDRAAPPNLDEVRTLLGAKFKGVSLDDHRQWQRQIRTVTRSFAAGGLAILLLVAAATMAIIISATRSAMASNREIVEVLHFVGATDRFISREFERNFLRLGVRAGLVGAVAAMAVFFLMPMVVELIGGGSVTVTELRRLIGTSSLDAPGYVLMVIVVVVIAAICMITSRLSVVRILNQRS